METTLSAPLIYLPWKLLNRGTMLINPNCGKDVTVVASQAAPCSWVTKYILQWSTREKLSEWNIFFLAGWKCFGCLERIMHSLVHIWTTSIILRSLARSFRGINSFKKSFISLLCESLRSLKRKGELRQLTIQRV